MHYPAIDPIIVAIGPLAVRWYGLAYIAAFAVSWWLGNRRADRDGSGWTREDVSDIVFYVAVGAVLGGRVGYMLFYQVDALLQKPWSLFTATCRVNIWITIISNPHSITASISVWALNYSRGWSACIPDCACRLCSTSRFAMGTCLHPITFEPWLTVPLLAITG